VEKMNHIQGLKKYNPDIVFVCWPEPDSVYDFLKLSNASYFIYIGEPNGYSTANDNFFKLLKSKYIEIYKKNIPAFYNGYLEPYYNTRIVNYFAIYQRNRVRNRVKTDK
jgi:hypothetical protein